MYGPNMTLARRFCVHMVMCGQHQCAPRSTCYAISEEVDGFVKNLPDCARVSTPTEARKTGLASNGLALRGIGSARHHGPNSMLLGINEVLLFVIGVAIFLATLDLSFRLGLRHRVADDDAGRSHILALQAALLGLLALLLGFTFAMSVARFEARKSLVLEEANAIRNAYLRSQLMDSPYPETFARLLKSYARARIDFHLAAMGDGSLDTTNDEAVRLESEIWNTARAAARGNTHSNAVTLLMIQSVSDMTDVNEKRHVALENRVPLPVHLLLFGVALGAMSFMGYGCGLNGKRRTISTGIFATLISFVLILIVDIDRPRTGLILVSQESMIRVEESMHTPAP